VEKMRRRLLAIAVSLGLVSVLFYGIPSTVAGPAHVVAGFVGPSTDPAPTNPTYSGNATFYLFNKPAEPILETDPMEWFPADGTDFANFATDVGTIWNWVVGDEIIAVIETTNGYRGWTGENYTTSFNATMNGTDPQDLNWGPGDPDIELIPTPAYTAGADWIELSWTGMTDLYSNIVDYEVYHSLDGGPFASVGSGALAFNHTSLTAGYHCYNMAVNYRSGGPGGVYTTTGRSPTVCQSLTAIVLTDPADSVIDVPVDRNINVTFSGPMNTGSVTITVAPDPGGWTTEWDSTSTVLWHNHSTPFAELTTHTVTVTGQDIAGADLVAGPVPNPWTFTTEDIPPYVVSTDPTNGQMNVPLDDPIEITFSEDMNQGSMVYTFEPALVLTETWPAGNVWNFTHATAYTECQQYWFNITAGTDLASISLENLPIVLTFTAFCDAPFIVSTDPSPSATVALDYGITVTFSEPMNIGTVVVTPVPDPGGWTPEWNGAETILYYNHSVLFDEVTTYTITVDGQDTGGASLIAQPGVNPWSFDTVGVPPTVISTDPFNGEGNVEVTRPINITFSEAMNDLTFTFSCLPAIVLTPSWPDAANVSHTHGGFAMGTTYTCQITFAEDANGVDMTGLPYSFSFTTQSAQPYLLSTTPADSATGVALDQSVIIEFSEEMNTGTVTWTPLPDPGGWVDTWNTPTNDILTLTHNAFAYYTQYTVQIDGEDVGGDTMRTDIGAPNPFTFWTISESPDASIDPLPACCPGGSDVLITWTMTDDITAEANLIVYLGYAYDSTTGLIAGPLTGDTSYLWTTPAIDNAAVTVNITVIDEEGNSAANVSAAFEIDSTAPALSTSDPADGGTGVALNKVIEIVFSDDMNQTATEGAISIDPSIAMTFAWTANDTVEVTLGSLMDQDTIYTVTISVAAEDTCGNNMTAADSFSFTTEILTPNPPTNLVASDEGTDKLTISWDAPTQFTQYNVNIPASATITYTLYMSETQGVRGTQVYQGTDATYEHTGLDAGKKYYYTATATVNTMTSADSAQLEAETSSEAGIGMWLWIIIIIIIIVIVAIIILLATRRKVPEEEEELPPPLEEEIEEVPPEEVEEYVEEAPPEEEFVEEAPPKEAPPEEPIAEAPPEEAPPAVEEAPAAAAVVEEGEEAPPEGKACPNCGTIVGPEDTTCFICGSEV
jgi:methionine-rich copper-binding protein CopC